MLRVLCDIPGFAKSHVLACLNNPFTLKKIIVDVLSAQLVAHNVEHFNLLDTK